LITPSRAGSVDRRERDRLHGALDRETVVCVRDRMWLVYLVLEMGLPRKAAAKILRRCARWVRKWLRRYREGGLAALPDLPRSGRPPAVGRKELAKAMLDISRAFVTPDRARSMIADVSGVVYHHATVRRIMRAFRLSPKVARLVHVNRASRRAVAAWWRRTKRRIARLRRRGFAVVVQDESIFVHDAVAGVKLWSPVGVPADVPYTGSHHKVVVYGAIAEDGRRPFRTRERFDAATFVWYLRELRRRFGRVAVILDRAPQHTARAVEAFRRSCGGDIVLIRLPVGSPYLSVVEEAWRRAKRKLLNSEHHPTREGFRRAIGEFFRGVRYGLDIYAYLTRTPSA